MPTSPTTPRAGSGSRARGADAAPYFRIFNPVLQGEKFDPAGAYVRRWVPELAAPARSLHPQALDGIAPRPRGGKNRLDKTYPAPIVDHDMARKRALAAFDTIKG